MKAQPPKSTLFPNMTLFRSDMRVHNARRFTAPKAKAMLERAGFAGVRTRYWNALLLPLMVVQRKLLARAPDNRSDVARSEEHTSELQSRQYLVCRLLLEKKK